MNTGKIEHIKDLGLFLDVRTRTAFETIVDFRTIKMRGKEVRAPRLTAEFASGDAKYKFPGSSNLVFDFEDYLTDWFEVDGRFYDNNDVNFASEFIGWHVDTIEREFGVKCNHCIVTLYRDGDDYIGYHSDKNIREVGVYTFSYGATRDILFKNKATKEVKRFTLQNGDLCYFDKAANDQYKHSIPKTKKLPKNILGQRISLTFRKI